MTPVGGSPGIRQRLCAGAGVLGAVLLLHGCASTPGASAMKVPEPAAIHDRDQAQAALAVVAASRAELVPQWRRRERDCYARFFVTTCLDKLGVERREAEYQLRRAEIRARTVLREAQIQIEVRDEAQRLDSENRP